MAFDSEDALRYSQIDSARDGWCAMGVANILQDQGLACTRGDAYTWAQTLPQNGWVLIEGLSPETAPEGAVLVYDRNGNHASLPESDRSGRRFGHVEVVTVDDDGNRTYTSDEARQGWGGSVPHNFVGVYVNPANYTAEQLAELQARGREQGFDASQIRTAGNNRSGDDAFFSAETTQAVENMFGIDLGMLTTLFTAVAAMFSGNFSSLTSVFASAAGNDAGEPEAPAARNTPPTPGMS